MVAFGIALAVLSSAASAQTDVAQADEAQDSSGQIRILEVAGLLDPVLADFLTKELDSAEADGVLAVVLQLDSRGSVLNDEDFTELARRFQASPLQVAMWVGPSGSQVKGGTAELLGVADVVGVAAGSRIGDTGPARLPADEFEPAFDAATERLETATISAEDAGELGISVTPIEEASVLRAFVENIEGYQSPAVSDDVALLTQAQFRQLPLSGQLFHTVASPEIAYLFFVGGLMLLVFELYTAGVGVAGAIGVGMLVLGCYGLAVLPARNLAIALLILSMIAFAIDIQTNIPRLYSGVGVMLFVAGTLLLYSGLTMSYVTIGFGIIGAVLFAYSGMPSMVRTRFSTPTIGRSWIVGEMGLATTELKPDGIVHIDDAPWRAITNRATPIEKGERVRVVAIERLVLEVEPEEGGAKDYRDRGPKETITELEPDTSTENAKD